MISASVYHSVQDTIKILNVSNQTFSLPPEYFALIGVVIGAMLAIGGNILLAKYKARVEIPKCFF